MMKRKGVFFLAAVCLLSVMLLPGAKKQADSVSQTVSPSDSQQPDNTQDAQALFPELSEDEITGIRIAAPDDCEFTFSVSEKNGLRRQRAEGGQRGLFYAGRPASLAFLYARRCL